MVILIVYIIEGLVDAVNVKRISFLLNVRSPQKVNFDVDNEQLNFSSDIEMLDMFEEVEGTRYRILPKKLPKNLVANRMLIFLAHFFMIYSPLLHM